MLSGTSGRLGVGSQIGCLVVYGGYEILRGFTVTGLSSSRSLETGDSAPLLSMLMVGTSETCWRIEGKV
jgi:hypothetical protein